MRIHRGEHPAKEPWWHSKNWIGFDTAATANQRMRRKMDSTNGPATKQEEQVAAGPSIAAAPCFSRAQKPKEGSPFTIQAPPRFFRQSPAFIRSDSSVPHPVHLPAQLQTIHPRCNARLLDLGSIQTDAKPWFSYIKIPYNVRTLWPHAATTSRPRLTCSRPFMSSKSSSSGTG